MTLICPPGVITSGACKTEDTFWVILLLISWYEGVLTAATQPKFF